VVSSNNSSSSNSSSGRLTPLTINSKQFFLEP
jgi:hypothetical protein